MAISRCICEKLRWKSAISNTMGASCDWPVVSTYTHGEISNNNIILALSIHNIVKIIIKLYYMLISVYDIYYNYFSIEGNIMDQVDQKMIYFEK